MSTSTQAFAQRASSPVPSSASPTTLAPIVISRTAPPPPPAGRPVRGYRWVEVDDDGRTPMPPDAVHVRRRARWPLVAGGVVFLGTWLFSGWTMFAGFICTSGSSSGSLMCSRWLDAWVWLPLAGPFIGATEVASTVHDHAWEAVFVVDGILQNAGLAVFIAGMLVPQRRVVRWLSPVYAGEREHRRWGIVPTLNGAALVGTF